ncbi:hypothetical protein A0H81_12723 [Grifola frondosa]|uniref:Uncharacterized protein n=1 Tax=Grifola frondosa TaxID=5627 RepID=A0A1C7LXH2_GRIFR|nr:hypothetical protein A0H81_12723 [Grifola frondosa]
MPRTLLVIISTRKKNLSKIDATSRCTWLVDRAGCHLPKTAQGRVHLGSHIIKPTPVRVRAAWAVCHRSQRRETLHYDSGKREMGNGADENISENFKDGNLISVTTIHCKRRQLAVFRIF